MINKNVFALIRYALALLGLVLLLGEIAAGQSRSETQKPQNSQQPDQSHDSNSLRFNPRAGNSLRFIPRPNNSLRFNPIEQSQKLGVQQVGEATAEATRQLSSRLAMSGPESMVDKADRLVEQGQLERAVGLYRKAIKTEPQLIGAHVGLGYALIKMGDFDGAVNEYQEAITYAPKNAEAQFNLGVALYRGGRITEAIEQYKRALAERKEHFPAAHFNLAMAYAHEGDFNQAIDRYRSAIEQRGKSYPEAYNNLGLIYEAMGDFQTAAEQFRTAIEQKRARYPLAHYNLGRFYYGQAKYDEAISEFQVAVKQQANFPEAYLELGNLYLVRSSLMGTDELNQAIAAYKRAIALRENFYPLAHENLAIALTKKKDKKEALGEYRIAFDQYEGQCPETVQNLISTILDKRAFLIGNELSRPDNAGNLTSKKSVVKPKERIAAALSKYEELDEELKDLPQVRYCAGLAYRAVGNLKAAAYELARALELSGNKDSEARRALISILELTLYL